MQPKPPLKRRCARCNRLFSPKRCDAVFCSAKCRTAIYRLRLADDAKVDDSPIFVASFRAESGIDGPRAFKALLKVALRKYGLRVVTTREEQSKGSRVAGQGTRPAAVCGDDVRSIHERPQPPLP
jgi:hypothetical protein